MYKDYVTITRIAERGKKTQLMKCVLNHRGEAILGLIDPLLQESLTEVEFDSFPSPATLVLSTYRFRSYGKSDVFCGN